MAKELYLYSPIYDFVAEGLIAQMEEYKTEDITIRANTPGGSVFSGWGIIAKMKEHEGSVTIKVDGSVASMGTYVLIFADNSEALDVSKIMIHRADMYVNTPEDQAFLDGVNKELKAKLKAKVNPDKFKEITGHTLDDIFNPDSKIDLWLTAKEAKAIGIINKIVKLEPSAVLALNRFDVAASETKPKVETKIMTTLNELKAQHPALFAEAVQVGVLQERDRVSACMVFNEIDPVGVKAAIESGSALSQKQMSEFALKAFSAKALAKLGDESTPPVQTTEESTKPQTEAQKQVEAFEKKVKADLGLAKVI